MRTKQLPLLSRTPSEWAQRVLEAPLDLLNDHAHLEKKAASNALDLLPRWPQANPPAKWVQVMTSVAKDEIEHLGIVTRILERRGGKMTRIHRNLYAQSLRDLVRMGRGNDELVDRLLISALIELRSCERFEVLSLNAEDRELAKLYRSLWASEHGHFKVFLELAYGISKKSAVDARWRELLKREAEILKAQPRGVGMHLA